MLNTYHWEIYKDSDSCRGASWKDLILNHRTHLDVCRPVNTSSHFVNKLPLHADYSPMSISPPTHHKLLIITLNDGTDDTCFLHIPPSRSNNIHT